MTEGSEAKVLAWRAMPARPPSGTIVLDLEVRNAGRRARWCCVPAQLPEQEGGVFAVETLRDTGSGLVLARVLGNGGRIAWLMAGGARVRIRELALTYWGEAPGRLEVAVEFATSISLGSERIEEWLTLKAAPLSDRADVRAGAATLQDSRTSPGHEAVPLVLGRPVERVLASGGNGTH